MDQRKYNPSTTFSWAAIQADWRALAVKYAGEAEGVRFLTLLYGLRDWDGDCPPPKTFSLTGPGLAIQRARYPTGKYL